ncbi:hypothetical protein [Polyangium spumosum]|uniref:Uncharacterized protein n=1 Tax=Polyangium spumosum TaxID=889282 RepID=A0A6N7PLI9_9BACT|nr:hypothetical protein [Polyangium spumosum]MRG90965.1 hypothetical protein [Polyangium spumosum]
MGRYICGTDGFSYKYATGEQDNNLTDLAAASGVGSSYVRPEFWAWMPEVEQNHVFDCITLAKGIVAETGAAGEITAVSRYPEAGICLDQGYGGYVLEFVQYAMAEQLLEVARRVDRALSHPARLMPLVGVARFVMSREEYPRMLAYVNGFLPENLAVSEVKILAARARGLDAAFGKQLLALRGKSDFLPFMGFQILCHAIWRDLPRVEVWEKDPAITATGFWENTPAWGPPWLRAADATTAEERWVSGLVRLFQGDGEGARTEFVAAREGGEVRATRWVEMLARIT